MVGDLICIGPNTFHQVINIEPQQNMKSLISKVAWNILVPLCFKFSVDQRLIYKSHCNIFQSEQFLYPQILYGILKKYCKLFDYMKIIFLNACDTYRLKEAIEHLQLTLFSLNTLIRKESSIVIKNTRVIEDKKFNVKNLFCNICGDSIFNIHKTCLTCSRTKKCKEESCSMCLNCFGKEKTICTHKKTPFYLHDPSEILKIVKQSNLIVECFTSMQRELEQDIVIEAHKNEIHITSKPSFAIPAEVIKSVMDCVENTDTLQVNRKRFICKSFQSFLMS